MTFIWAKDLIDVTLVNQDACLHLPLVLLHPAARGCSDEQFQSPSAQTAPGKTLFHTFSRNGKKNFENSACLTKVEGDDCVFLPFLSPEEKSLLLELVREKIVEDFDI